MRQLNSGRFNWRLLFSIFVAIFVFQTVGKAQELFNSTSKNIKVKEINVVLPFHKTAQKINVEFIDGFAILEGDIILGKEVEFTGNNAVAIAEKNYRWKDGVIPYVIQDGHPKTADIKKAILKVNASTNLCLVPRSNQQDYVEFYSGSGCSSFVGRQGGRQYINIGPCSFGSIIHEICHAAGLWHEQSRCDRDNHITVNTANIKSGKERNFNKHCSDGLLLGTYDYGSIMHYSAYAFSKNGNKTIEVKIPPGTTSTRIGQRVGLSQGDINGINSIYRTKSCGNHIQIPGVGWEGQGAGSVLTNLDSDKRPELILMAYDNPKKGNSFRYKIGWNLDANGKATRWSKFVQVAGVGWEGQGAGSAITNLDGNKRPELILMAYDNPKKGNSFRYKIGWNLDANGKATRWSKFVQVAGVGWEGQGAGTVVFPINGTKKLLLMAYDNPRKANSFRYKVVDLRY